VTATMTISTVAPHTAPASAVPIFPEKWPWQPLFILVLVLSIGLLTALPRVRRRLVFVLLLFSIGVFAGCGGGSSVPPVIQIPGTTPGAYNFVVTASTPGPNASLSVVTAQATVTVTVQ
jgi:hypothetical protein